MSPSKKSIGELIEKSWHCMLKVKIVKTFRPMCSLEKTKYQRYVMQDEKACEKNVLIHSCDQLMYTPDNLTLLKRAMRLVQLYLAMMLTCTTKASSSMDDMKFQMLR